ncbi:MAG: hypothetical protein WA231_08620, partial [Methylocella sp.]
RGIWSLDLKKRASRLLFRLPLMGRLDLRRSRWRRSIVADLIKTARVKMVVVPGKSRRRDRSACQSPAEIAASMRVTILAIGR